MRKVVEYLFIYVLISIQLFASDYNFIGYYDKGFLEEIEGIYVLHLKGDPYEVGYQYGKLACEQIKKTLNIFYNYFDQYLPGIVNILKPMIINPYLAYIPEDIMMEIQGICDSCDVEPEDLLGIICATDFSETAFFEDFGFNCSGLALWGDLTIDGKMFQLRNLDWAPIPQAREGAMIVCYNIDNKIPFANIGWAGMLGVILGMNANGLGMSEIGAKNLDEIIPFVEGGIPWSLLTRDVLSRANNVREVEDIIRKANRTQGFNFIFGDGKNFEGRAIEVTKNHFASFKDNDPKEDEALYEGECYAIKIENAVFRADTAMDPIIRSTQVAANGPDGDPRESGSYKNRYKKMANMVINFKNNDEKIDINKVELISREVAINGVSLCCAIYANTDRYFRVAYGGLNPDGTWQDASKSDYIEIPYNLYLNRIDIIASSENIRPGEHFSLQLKIKHWGPAQKLKFLLMIYNNDITIYYPDFNSVPKLMEVELSEDEEKIIKIVEFDVDFNIKNVSLNWLAILTDLSERRLIDFDEITTNFWE